MAVIRKNNKEKYTVVPTHIIRDEDLSLKDIGLLVSLLSLPDNWEFSENGLETIYKNDGITSIRTGLKKLEKCGYLKRIRLRGKDGRIISVEWYVYEKPHLEKPHLENPSEVNPSEEKHTQYNTKQYNTKELNTKENILPKGNNMSVSKNETNLDYSKFLNYFNSYSKLKSITAITTKRKTLLNARLKEFGVNSFKTVVDNCSKSLFLQGQNKKGWMATFDWLILPNNYVKVLEGNYNSQENELYNELDRRAKAVESNLELKSLDDFETHEVELYDPKGITHN